MLKRKKKKKKKNKIGTRGMDGQRGREGDILQDVWLGMGGVGTCGTKKNLTLFFLPFFSSLFLKKKNL